MPIHIVIADVSDLAAVSRIPEELPTDFQEVDILVNNAGVIRHFTSKDFNLMIDCINALSSKHNLSLPGNNGLIAYATFSVELQNVIPPISCISLRIEKRDLLSELSIQQVFPFGIQFKSARNKLS